MLLRIVTTLNLAAMLDSLNQHIFHGNGLYVQETVPLPTRYTELPKIVDQTKELQLLSLVL